MKKTFPLFRKNNKEQIFCITDEKTIFINGIHKYTNIDLKRLNIVSNELVKHKNVVIYNGNSITTNTSFKFIYGAYRSDEKGVYYGDILFDKIDSKTFEILIYPHFIRDKNNIYYLNEIVTSKTKDREHIGGLFSKDGQKIFYKSKIFPVDFKSFKYLGETNDLEEFSKDNKYLYSNNKIIKNAISKKARLINNEFLISNGIMYNSLGQKICSINESNLSIITLSNGKTLIKTENNIYHGPFINKHADPASFKNIGMNYSFDKNNIYSGIDLIIKGSDKKTFEIIGKNLAKDKNYSYFQNKKLPIRFNGEIENLGSEYIKDQNNIYYIGKLKYLDQQKISKNEIVIKGINQAFTTVYGPYITDHLSVWHENKKIKNIDRNTFTVLLYGWAKDKNNVYCDGKIVKELNPATTKVLTLDSQT